MEDRNVDETILDNSTYNNDGKGLVVCWVGKSSAINSSG